MAPPETKLVVDLGVSLIAFNKQFCLLEVGKSLEGKVRGSGIAMEWELHVFRASRKSREFPR